VIRYLADEELQALEKKYFDILEDIISSNLGSFISQVYTQMLIKDTLIKTNQVNQIEGAVENIVESLITERMHWKICSMAASSDSCFECGDAIVHIDAKTMLVKAEDNVINVEKNQTSYIEGDVLYVGKNSNSWTPNLKWYENHTFYGYVPNLTYVVRVLYSEESLVENIYLVCLPNGQLGDVFNREKILNAGKSKSKMGEALNIRFNLKEIIKVPNQEWRLKQLYSRIASSRDV